jgi:DNA-binding NtrC family response regulator
MGRHLAVTDASFHGLIGRSAPMRAVLEQIVRVAQVDTTVLVEGETGTGKERGVRAIHQASPRAGKPFITVNCAGLTETLAASELFGHRRGAFTGAVTDHKGAFEAADGGTLFLDEIGDVPRSQQPYLLRVLEEREVTRVGETAPRKIDVRVLAATNRNLEDEVAAGRFRSDLFYRVRVARILMPPLRERAGDVPLLAEHFLAQLSGKTAAGPRALSEQAMETLATYPWPGNVRELKNAIEFAALRCAGALIQPADLPPELLETRPAAHRPPLSPAEEKTRLLEALSAAKGNRTQAARLVGVSRATFYRRLRDLGVTETE